MHSHMCINTFPQSILHWNKLTTEHHKNNAPCNIRYAYPHVPLSHLTSKREEKVYKMACNTTIITRECSNKVWRQYIQSESNIIIKSSCVNKIWRYYMRSYIAPRSEITKVIYNIYQDWIPGTGLQLTVNSLLIYIYIATAKLFNYGK